MDPFHVTPLVFLASLFACFFAGVGTGRMQESARRESWVDELLDRVAPPCLVCGKPEHPHQHHTDQHVFRLCPECYAAKRAELERLKRPPA